MSSMSPLSIYSYFGNNAGNNIVNSEVLDKEVLDNLEKNEKAVQKAEQKKPRSQHKKKHKKELTKFQKDYFNLKLKKANLRPFDLEDLQSNSKSLLHLTLTQDIAKYLIDTEIFKKGETRIGEYPLYVDVELSQDPKTVFFYDFIRGSAEIDGFNVASLDDWIEVRVNKDSVAGESSKGLDKNSEVGRKIMSKLIEQEFLFSGFTKGDIKAIYESYHQALFYVDKYVLWALFQDLFFNFKTEGESLDSKWHIKHCGYKCRFNIYKNKSLVFAKSSITDLTINHVKLGECFIPGSLTTYFYLDQVNLHEGAPVWRLYKNYQADKDLIRKLQFVDQMDKSISRSYGEKGGCAGLSSDSWQMIFLFNQCTKKKDDIHFVDVSV